MNANVSPALPASAAAAAPERETRPLEHTQIVQVLAAIRADSQRDADRYLTDTVVPHGGE
jgi:hypothetical protein